MSEGGQQVALLTLNGPRPKTQAELVQEALQSGGYYVHLALAVRPWVDVTSFPVPREAKAPDIVRPDAFIEWGGPSEFAFDTFRADARNIGFNEKDDDKKPKRVRYGFNEDGRGWKDVRVENPQDPDQYVIARDATALSLSGPHGEQFLATLHPTAPGDRTGSGQTPPSPPPLDQIGDE